MQTESRNLYFGFHDSEAGHLLSNTETFTQPLPPSLRRRVLVQNSDISLTHDSSAEFALRSRHLTKSWACFIKHWHILTQGCRHLSPFLPTLGHGVPPASEVICIIWYLWVSFLRSWAGLVAKTKGKGRGVT